VPGFTKRVNGYRPRMTISDPEEGADPLAEGLTEEEPEAESEREAEEEVLEKDED
jgi:hypothetical protein